MGLNRNLFIRYTWIKKVADLCDKRPRHNSYKFLYLHALTSCCNLAILLLFLTDLSAKEIHENTRRNKDQKQTGYETVNTGGLCDRTTKKHSRSNITLALRLTSDCFQSLSNCITFSNTRSDTCDQCKTSTNCTTSQCDTFANTVNP